LLAIEQSAKWLTGRRIRTHGLLLAVCLWTVYAVTMATPGRSDRNGLIKGTDFVHFYTLGSLAHQGRGDLLYDMHGQAQFIGRSIPEAANYLFVPLYGPQVSLFFAPLTQLSYGWALTVWLLFNVFLYLGCCFAIWRVCPNLQKECWTMFILAAAFPGLFHLLLWGQTSGLALACFTLAYLGLWSKHDFLAGLAIGCLFFKPQLGLAAAVVFVIGRQWQVVGGAVVAMAAQLGAGWLYYGTEVMRRYLQALLHVGNVLPLLEPRPYQMHSLRAFWALLVPWPEAAFVLYVISALAVLALLAGVWLRDFSLEVRFSALLIASVLVSPHLTVYDLVVLAPAFLLLADWGLGQPRSPSVAAIQVLLYLCYLSFLLGPLVRLIHIKLSVIAMFTLLWLISRSAVGARQAALAA
jgi:Glycosyltransferase family 87